MHLALAEYGRGIVRRECQRLLETVHRQGILVFTQGPVTPQGEGIGIGVLGRIPVHQVEVYSGGFVAFPFVEVDIGEKILIPDIRGVCADGCLQALLRIFHASGHGVALTQIVVDGIIALEVLIEVFEVADGGFVVPCLHLGYSAYQHCLQHALLLSGFGRRICLDAGWLGVDPSREKEEKGGEYVNQIPHCSLSVQK